MGAAKREIDLQSDFEFGISIAGEHEPKKISHT